VAVAVLEHLHRHLDVDVGWLQPAAAEQDHQIIRFVPRSPRRIVNSWAQVIDQA
jgi:hypothetical protein